MSDERDRAVAHKLADLSSVAAAHLTSVLRGKTATGAKVKATIAERTKVAFGVLALAGHDPGLKVTVDATVHSKPLDDGEALLELQEMLELQVAAAEPLAIAEAEEVH